MGVGRHYYAIFLFEYTMQYLAKHLSIWFSTHARDLLWRHDVTPYRVWVSEIMLQQTQVATVTPYFERWMRVFPTLEALAEAEESDVMSLWAGLGYYRRARYLHRGAKFVVENLHGVFPSDIAELKKIPGIGDYTSGAIASIALGQDVPAIDGNVERVLGRYFAIFGDLKGGDARKKLERYAQGIAKCGNAGVVNQALMDLGASFCGKKADCEACPLKAKCAAYAENLTAELPQRAVRAAKQMSWQSALFLVDDDMQLLLVRRNASGLLGGLWSLPMMPLCADTPRSEAEAALYARASRFPAWSAWLVDHNLQNNVQSCLPTGSFVRHIFTHIDMRVTLDVAHYRGAFSNMPKTLDNDDLFDRIDVVTLRGDVSDFSDHPISTLIKKLLKHVNDIQKSQRSLF